MRSPESCFGDTDGFESREGWFNCVVDFCLFGDIMDFFELELLEDWEGAKEVKKISVATDELEVESCDRVEVDVDAAENGWGTVPSADVELS